MKDKITTIKVHASTRDELKPFKKANKSFEKAILFLIDWFKTAK
jgi:hypothetical protein